MAAYKNFLFSAEPQSGLFGKLHQAVRNFKPVTKTPGSIMTDGNRLRLEFGREDYYFYFVTADGPAVAEEARDIANQHARRSEASTIKDCTYRIEFYGDDDEAMDYFNEYYGLMEVISKIPGVVIYDYVNSTFFGD